MIATTTPASIHRTMPNPLRSAALPAMLGANTPLSDAPRGNWKTRSTFAYLVVILRFTSLYIQTMTHELDHPVLMPPPPARWSLPRIAGTAGTVPPLTTVTRSR